MGTKLQERCMGCMKLLSWDGSCPNCGFDKSRYPSDSHYLPLGTLLKNGDYMVGRVLGEGGFGITYIGFDQNLLSRVAIKEYYPSGFAGRDVTEGNFTLRVYGGDYAGDYYKGLEAFLEEARILAKFAGMDGIVNVRSLFQENGTAYIVMEYVDGISVKEYVHKHGKMEPKLVLEMMEQPIRALQAVHEEHLVHRDVSADNFMLDKEGKITLIDFGAARYSNVIDEKTRTTICKQGFSALEQYSREGKQGPWTDVYSICATMYYMLTGIVPKNSTERIVDDAVVPLDQISEIELSIEKKRSIMTGMAVKSSDRFQNMSVLYLAIYGKPLIDGVLHREFILRGEQKSSNEKKEILRQIGSPTGILQELSQVSARRKNREKRKKIKRIVQGAVVVTLLLLLFWNLRGRMGFEERKQVKQVSESNQLVQNSQLSGDDATSANAQKEKHTWQEGENRDLATNQPSGSSQPTAEAKTVKVPKVAGLKKKAAIKKIEKCGLRYKVVYRNSSSVAEGIVIRSGISAGKKVKIGKKIALYVSKGKKVENAAKTSVATPKPKQNESTDSKNKKDDLAGDLDKILY